MNIDDLSFYWPWIARLAGLAGAFIMMGVALWLAASSQLTPSVVELAVPWIGFCGTMIGIAPMFEKQRKRNRHREEEDDD